MYERILKIAAFFGEEDKNPNDYISEETQEKYKIFKKWLIDNGAIFQKNIDFPYTYGPFHIVGCKCVSDISDDEGILLVPKNLMIIGKDLTYIGKLIEDVKDQLSDEEDLSTLYLTLNLYLEKNNKNSFFKPYIDLIYTNRDYFDTWNEENLLELQNAYMARSIRSLLAEIDLMYNLIKRCKAFANMTKKEYSFCYFNVISRQFYLDQKNSALVPLADLLNHSTVSIHYEIYDGENMVFKYSDHFTVEEDIKIDIRPTYLKEVPIIQPTYNKLQPIVINKDKEHYPSEEIYESDEDDIIVKINKNDYFCISTSMKQKMKKNSQAFNNYCDINNKSLLKYYGFCLIDNIFDYTDVVFQFNKNDNIINGYFPSIFHKRYKNNIDSRFNILKIRCEYRNVCIDLIKYYQFMYYYDSNRINEFFLYKFNYSLEIASIQLAIYGLNLKYKMMDIIPLEKELNDLENEIYKERNPKQLKVNFLIYRIRQKINILNQIDLLNTILKMMKKHKKITKYEDLFQYLNELENVSRYDNEDQAKLKIINFIDIMSKIKQ